MNLERKKAFFAGLLILVAYAVLASLLLESKILVVLLESFSGIAVIVIAILVYPYVKSWNHKTTMAYLIAKIIEGVLLIIAAVLFLSKSVSLLGIRELIIVSHAYFFIAASALLYYLLYISKLVPRYISIWGLVALLSLLIGNLMEISGITHPLVMAFYLNV